MQLRPRSSSAASGDEYEYPVESASKWDGSTIVHMNIVVKDVNDLFSDLDISADAKRVVLPEWKDTKWLTDVDLVSAPYSKSIKSLIEKVHRVVRAQQSMTEVLVDGFMYSLLFILGFDDYPCTVYPQYVYSTRIGLRNHLVQAKADYGVLSGSKKLMLVVEDKTVTTATYANNWKEDQVMGELFVAVHDLHHYGVGSDKVDFPVIMYAVRVVGTLFTFYKAVGTLDYIKETSRTGTAINNEMVVERYPPIEDNPFKLTAFDICNLNDRMRILKCLCSIRDIQ